jgi:hypothetical protein
MTTALIIFKQFAPGIIEENPAPKDVLQKRKSHHAIVQLKDIQDLSSNKYFRTAKALHCREKIKQTQ